MVTKTLSTLTGATAAAAALGATTNDWFTILPSVDGVLDMKGGLDKVTLRGDGNTLGLSNTETVIGGSGSDLITVDAQGKFVDLGADDDSFTLGAAMT
eukprot:gene8190-11093_t